MTKFALLCGASCAGLLITAPALAQSAAPSCSAAPQANPSPTTSDTSQDGLADIVVTALKRETNVQKTPVVIDVVSGDQLNKAGVTNITALSNIAPTLNFGQANGIYTVVTIRGVSSQDATELGDPATSFSVDGESISRPLNLAASLFDIARIEVLRGPQGTLYGRNSTAGAVNIVTERPSHDFSASITGSAGTFDQFGVQGYINIPVADWLAIRASGIFSKHKGYTNTELGRVVDDENVTGGRIRALFTPTSRLSLLVTGEIIHTAGGGPATSGVRSTGTAGTLPLNVMVSPPDRRYVLAGIDPELRTTQRDVRAEGSYDFGFAKLTDVIAYRTTKLDQLQNFSGTPTFGVDYRGFAQYKTFGNEIRLSNGDGSPFTWQVGYFYFNEKQFVDSKVYSAIPFAVRDVTNVLEFLYPEVKSTSNAFFGEVTVPIASGFSVTGGIRHTSDDKSRVGTQYTLNIPAFIGSGGTVVGYIPASATGASKDAKWTYNAVANWQVAPSNLVYAKVSTGYKSGGFTTINSYGPESLTAYEVGTKNRFMDGKLQLNADIFYYKYRDQQIQTFVSTGAGTSAASTQNAASSREWGVEFEGIARVTPNDRIRLTADYLNTKFENFVGAVSAYGGATVPINLSGSRLPFAPEWTLTATLTHDFHFAWGDVTAEVRSAYKSDYYLAAYNYPSLRQPGYTNTDASLTYTSPKGQWSLTAFVRNIEDKRVYRFANFAASGANNFFLWQFSDPRTAGVRATINFK